MRHIRSPWRRAAAALVTGLVILTLGLTGCSAKRDTASSTAEKAPAGGAAQQGAPAAQDGGAKDEAGKPLGDTANGAQPAKDPTKVDVSGRSIIYTGTITVRVEDVDTAASRASTVATGAGGFIGGDQRTIDARRSEARLTLRVPSERFGATVDDLGRLGKEENRQIDTQDVTEQVVDVDARIAVAQASVDRVRALMDKAQSLSEIVSLESEYSRRLADLESLQARKRRLGDLTAMSTITLVLLGPDAKTEKPATGFVAGVKAGWKAFLASMEILLTVLGALLPWIIAIGVPVYLVVWLVRRLNARRPRRPVVPAMATTPAGPGGPAGMVTAPPPGPGAGAVRRPGYGWPPAGGPGGATRQAPPPYPVRPPAAPAVDVPAPEAPAPVEPGDDSPEAP